MTIILIVSLLIILVVIFLSVLTVNKGYQYKHTIDPAPHSNEHSDNNKQENESQY